MNKFILVAFGFMGFAFYELSGGADFEAGTNSITVFAEPSPKSPEISSRPSVDRVARLDNRVAQLASLPADTVPVIADPIDLSQVQPASTVATIAINTAIAAAPEEPIITVENETVAPEPVEQLDIRLVTGNRVNMRGGPGTGFEVVGKLVKNDAIEVLEDSGRGWLRLRAVDSGEEGWMADWLVTAAN